MARPRSTKITVRVMNNAVRDGFILWWRDPLTGKKPKRTAASANFKEALREAAALEVELRSNSPGSLEGWGAFRRAVETRYYPHVGDETRALSRQVLGRWEKAIGVVADLSSIGASHIAIFESSIASPSTQTKAKYLRQLKVLLNWGHRQGFIAKVPHIELPRQPKGFAGKGGPKSQEDIAAMLVALKGLVGAASYHDWEDCVYGALHSGLRVNEVLRLTWGRLQILPSGVVLISWGRTDQKSKKAETTATVPEFAALVKRRATGKEMPADRVFCPRTPNGFYVSPVGFAKKLSQASGGAILPHDLRRTFADHWSKRLYPVDLSRVMRCGINTIMKFYAQADSEKLALEIMQQHSTQNAPRTP